MMRHLVRGAALLLLAGLAAVSAALQEPRFVLAALAILGLVEMALALRRRRSRQQAPADRFGFTATRVACSQEHGALRVALIGQEPRGGATPSLLLSRKLPPPGQAVPARENHLHLELSGRTWSFHGGVQDAHLQPRLLHLTLDPRGAEFIGAGQICVTLQAGHDQRQLERALGRILRGVAFVSERSIPEDLQDPLSAAAMAHRSP